MNFRALLRCVFAVAVVTAFVVPIFADTIRLKDGSTIKGRITGFTGGKFTVAVGEGNRRREFTFTAGEIESIEFDRTEVLDRNVSAVNANVKVDDNAVVNEPIVRNTPAVSNPAPKTTQTTNYNPTKGLIKPIAINVNVLADSTSNGWTNSGWVVKKGQRIRITAEGDVSLGKGQKSGPGGQYTLDDEKKLLKSVPTGALIAVIGDDNNDFIYIGADREFVATRDGTLFLGLNEGNLDDNSGSYKVKVEISPEG